MITFPVPPEVKEVMAARGNKHFRNKRLSGKTFEEIRLFSLDSNRTEVFNSPQSKSKGKLVLVSTPIGSYYDITFRALRLIKEADILVCEDAKETSRLLKFFGFKKELLILNEHNERDSVPEYISMLITGKDVTLVSDCGTPAFADPGLTLVNECIANNIDIDFIHGANSVIAAVVVSGFDISRFYFYGFLSPKNEIRVKEIRNISSLPHPVILMDTPYRLHNLVNDINDTIPERKISLSMNLSAPGEKHLRGTSAEIITCLKDIFGDSKPKAEFILVLDKQPK